MSILYCILSGALIKFGNSLETEDLVIRNSTETMPNICWRQYENNKVFH